jgi:hypothetical protein
MLQKFAESMPSPNVSRAYHEYQALTLNYDPARNLGTVPAVSQWERMPPGCYVYMLAAKTAAGLTFSAVPLPGLL